MCLLLRKMKREVAPTADRVEGGSEIRVIRLKEPVWHTQKRGVWAGQQPGRRGGFSMLLLAPAIDVSEMRTWEKSESMNLRSSSLLRD